VQPQQCVERQRGRIRAVTHLGDDLRIDLDPQEGP